jgi:hypothetical protein
VSDIEDKKGDKTNRRCSEHLSHDEFSYIYDNIFCVPALRRRSSEREELLLFHFDVLSQAFQPVHRCPVEKKANRCA